MSERSAYHARGRAYEGAGMDFRTDRLDSAFKELCYIIFSL